MTLEKQKELEGIVGSLGSRSRPELGWISRVVGCSRSEARDAVEGVLAHADTIDGISGRIGLTGRSYYAQFPAPIELYALVRLTRPKSIVESGVASGISSAFLLLGAGDNGGGTLHSIDLPTPRKPGKGNEPWAMPAGLSSGWAVPAELKEGWDLRLGRSEDLLEPLLEEIGGLDLYCHDSPVDKRHFEFEMGTIGRRLRPGSLVVADNTDWEAFEDAARLVGGSAVRRRHSSLGAFVAQSEWRG